MCHKPEDPLLSQYTLINFSQCAMNTGEQGSFNATLCAYSGGEDPTLNDVRA